MNACIKLLLNELQGNFSEFFLMSHLPNLPNRDILLINSVIFTEL